MKNFWKGLWKLFRQFCIGFVKLVKPVKKGTGTQALLRRYAEVAWRATQAWRLQQLLVPGARLIVHTPELRITILMRVLNNNAFRVGQWGPGKDNSWFAEGVLSEALGALAKVQTNANAWQATCVIAGKLREGRRVVPANKERILKLMEQ